MRKSRIQRLFPSRLVLTVTAAVWLLVAGQVVAIDHSSRTAQQYMEEIAASFEGEMFVQVFGCVMPLPPGYVLRADAKPFFFYRRTGEGNIWIKPYKALDASGFEIVEEKPIGPLRLVTVKATFGHQVKLTFVHDGKTKMTIIGQDAYRIEEMARRCLQHEDYPCPEDATRCAG